MEDKYSQYRSSMKAGDLVEFSNPTSFIGRGIRAVTGEEVNHSALIKPVTHYYPRNHGRILIIEALSFGVEQRYFSRVVKHYKGKIIWYPLKSQYDDMRNQIIERAMEFIWNERPYDYGAIARFLFRMRVKPDPRKVYCTEVCQTAYKAAGLIQTDVAMVPGELPKYGLHYPGVRIK